MEKKLRTSVTEEQWQRAVDDYERGTKHAVQIADDLGVSASTVSREFKRRGCVKACRVAEVMAPLEAELDRRARRRAILRRAQEDAAARRAEANNRLIDEMIQSIVAAMKAGDLSLAAPTVNEVGKSLGVKLAR
jgi:IS30 family transposase